MNTATTRKGIGGRLLDPFVHARLLADNDMAYRARILVFVVLAALVEHAVLFAALMLSQTLANSQSVTLPINLGSIAAMSLGLYVLRRHGSFNLCCFVIVAQAFLAIVYAMFITGGPYYSPASQLLILPSLMSFFFGGIRWGVMTLAVSFTTLVIMLTAQLSGFAYPQYADPVFLPFGQLFILPINFALVSALAFAYEYSSVSLQRERDEEHRKFVELARTDPLTGLANRRIFDETLQARIELYERLQPPRSFVLCYLDLDRFKPINDDFGHDTGDEVLGLVSQRLMSALRGADFIGRHGGDEFLILFDGVHTSDAIGALGNRLLQLVREPIPTHAGVMRIDASLGFASYPAHGRDLATLQKAADAAMYEAKRTHRGFHIHQSALS